MTTRVSLDSYSISTSQKTCESEFISNVQTDKAFEIAKAYLQEQVKESIWDWDEDVSLLNLAAVLVGR